MNAITRTWPHSTFVGFDRIWNDLDRYFLTGAESAHAFPRHNVIKSDDENYQIELALAGYSRDDLTIEVKDGILIVAGEKSDADVNYLHKGISTKKFRRTFQLNENVVVKDANFVDGLLTIDLNLIVPEERKPRTIDIGKKSKALPSK